MLAYDPGDGDVGERSDDFARDMPESHGGDDKLGVLLRDDPLGLSENVPQVSHHGTTDVLDECSYTLDTKHLSKLSY